MFAQQKFGSKMLKISIILFGCFIFFFVLTMVQVANLNDENDALNYLQDKSIQQLNCSQLSLQYSIDQISLCCIPQSDICKSKEICYQQKLSDLRNNIEDMTDEIIIFGVPSGICFLISLFVAMHYYQLRRRLMMRINLSRELERSLEGLENPLNDQLPEEYYGDDQEFRNYEEYIQFMVQNGYFQQILNVGDQKIAQSFATNDDSDCPVCMMTYSQMKVLRLRCGHKFHSECIRDWNKSKSSCPVCRANIYD